MATPPEDSARSHHELPHLEATPDAAEADVLVRGHASRLDIAVLGVRQFLVKALARIRELRPQNLNLSWITDSLAVGGSFRPRDVRRLRAQGVTAVLDLREEASDDAELLTRHGIQFLRLPTPDAHPPSQPDFERGVEWVLDQQAAGNKVFVH
jgi:protein tyrosine phosphatase (PTP) superfamily phosphohydrolase (DUF442 family)